MQAVLLVIHVIIALALIGIILIQRSDSDGFGLGSGSGSNFMTGRSAANFLTRTTAILATLFIVNSLVLGVLAGRHSGRSIADTIVEQEASAPAVPVDDEKKSGDSGDKASAAAGEETPAKAEEKPAVKTEAPAKPVAEKPAAKEKAKAPVKPQKTLEEPAPFDPNAMPEPSVPTE